MTDKAYTEWTQKQRSAISGKADWVRELGEWRCEAAHVNRVANGAGRGHKGEDIIPLTHTEHTFYHAKGELALLMENGHRTTREAAKDFFEHLAKRNRQRYEQEKA